MNYEVVMIIGIICAVIGTVLVLALLTPQKRRDSLPPFLRTLADIFNFRGLLLEHIVKALYILSTLFCIFSGFFMLFAQEKYYSYYSYIGYRESSKSLALYGLLLMVVGPIAVRIFYEVTMMFIILVKNVMQINNKLDGKGNDKNEINGKSANYEQHSASVKQDPAPQEAPKEPKLYCAQCGTPYYPEKGGCPNGCE